MPKGTVSKSRFKARALEHMRQVERTGNELVITDRGTPVVKIVPYERDPAALLKPLRGTVRRYSEPTRPVAEKDWEALRRSCSTRTPCCGGRTARRRSRNERGNASMHLSMTRRST